MTVSEVEEEIRYAWANAYSPAATRKALDSIADEPVPYKISHLVARLFFRGIYFPQRSVWAAIKLMAQNRSAIFRVIRDSFARWHGAASGPTTRGELGSILAEVAPKPPESQIS
jgi:hypothetical protein